MNYQVGQKLVWKPDYFKWDKERVVEVVKTYPRGYAGLSNGFIVDEDGYCDWHRKIAGTVSIANGQ